MSSKKSLRELREMMTEATELVPLGSVWRHYKGGVYTVEHIAYDEVTSEFEVVYRPEEAADVYFTRSLSVWLETVQWQGAALPRFEHIAA
ncbi:DUF1653 domain-containing protein [Candidatus Saccharibacteria bacterium]|nr:DUF1653 domain-containing protein [Candidatus Saccharibacteria bacterium]